MRKGGQANHVEFAALIRLTAQRSKGQKWVGREGNLLKWGWTMEARNRLFRREAAKPKPYQAAFALPARASHVPVAKESPSLARS